MKAEALKWDVNRDVELKQNYLNNMLNWEKKDKNGNIIEKISEEQKQKMVDFDKKAAINGIKVTSRCSNISYLKDFAVFVKKPFETVTKKDVEDYFYNLINKKLSSITIRNRKITIKQFYQWLYNTRKGEYPEIVSWLDVNSEYNYKLPSDIVTQEEVKQMLDKGCCSIQQKAVISLMWETAIRGGECVGINVEDVIFENTGANIFIRRSKTKQRELFVYDSVPILKQWINTHPFKDVQGSPLFFCVSNRDYGKRLSVSGLTELVMTVAERASLKKHVTSHILRHGSLTLQSTYLSDSELKLQAGWTASSMMPRIYLHLTTEDLRRKQMQRRGIVPEDNRENQMQSIICPRCRELNDCTFIFCSKCSFPLNKQEALKISATTKLSETMMSYILDDKMIQDRIIQLKQEDPKIKRLSETLAKIVPTV
jgi:integrase